jgi:hypothetical protein
LVWDTILCLPRDPTALVRLLGDLPVLVLGLPHCGALVLIVVVIVVVVVVVTVVVVVAAVVSVTVFVVVTVGVTVVGTLWGIEKCSKYKVM